VTATPMGARPGMRQASASRFTPASEHARNTRPVERADCAPDSAVRKAGPWSRRAERWGMCEAGNPHSPCGRVPMTTGTAPAMLRGAMQMSGTAAVDLYWIPLGTGGHSVRFNGRVFEAIAAMRQHRPRCELYHAALIVEVDGERYTIEIAPSPDADEASRGVVASGAVGSRYVGWSRLFRYEVRCWQGGSIPISTGRLAGRAGSRAILGSPAGCSTSSRACPGLFGDATSSRRARCGTRTP
jgi:hypothetical protein